jgi:two-component system sensor histidine kinase PhoQ
MMHGPPSVSRRLLVSVAVPLLLFFVLTASAIDYVFREQSTAALRDRLEEQVVALITAVDLDFDGKLVVNLLDPESRLDVPGSGQYAALRDDNGKLLWSSPSLAGTALTLGSKLPVGGVQFRYQTALDGSTIAELSRGLQWAYGSGLSKKLVFTAADSTAPQMRELWLFRQRMAGWFGALDLVLLATMAWMMRRALAPVRRLEQEIAALESGKAAQLGEGYPRELAGVTAGLNALLQSERNRIVRYRDTLGNLAHSLKTPLAVIRASLGSAESEERRSEAAIQLEIDRGGRRRRHARTGAGVGAAAADRPARRACESPRLKGPAARDRCAGGAGILRRQRRYPRVAGQRGG